MNPLIHMVVIPFFVGCWYTDATDIEPRPTIKMVIANEGDVALIKSLMMQMNGKVDILSVDIVELSRKFDKCQLQLNEQAEHIEMLEGNIREHIDPSKDLIIDKLEMAKRDITEHAQDLHDRHISMISGHLENITGQLLRIKESNDKGHAAIQSQLGTNAAKITENTAQGNEFLLLGLNHLEQNISVSLIGVRENLKEFQLKVTEEHQEVTDILTTIHNQTSPTRCSRGDEGCSHSCVMDPYTGRANCTCPPGLRLTTDNKTCGNDSGEIMLLACKSELRLMILDSPDYYNVILHLDNVEGAFGIDYDPIDKKVYWTELTSKTIQCANLDGTNQTVVISTDLVSPYGVAVDWIARNLYWTDDRAERIEVSRLDGTSRRVLISDLDGPFSIVLDPINGYMYWTAYGSPAKIERANLDGSDRLVLVDSSIWEPFGLAIDINEQKLYWGEAKKSSNIEVMNLNGTGRRVIIDGGVGDIRGLSVLGDYLYWTIPYTYAVLGADKRTGNRTELITEPVCLVVGLKAVNSHHTEGTNGCYQSNGGCSHLCLHRPDPLGFICACPMEMELQADGKTCMRL